MSRRPVRFAVVLAAGIALSFAVANAGRTQARFTDAPGLGSNSFSSATLQAPTGLAASGGCTALLAPKVTLTWTATSSTFADGYDVYRGTASGGPYSNIGHVVGRTTTTYTDTSVNLNRTYYYVLRSTAFSWTSANSAQASATTPLICL
jgi:hypothetical protein